MKKTFLIALLSITLFPTSNIIAQETINTDSLVESDTETDNVYKLSIGSSLNEEQVKELQAIFNSDDSAIESAVITDGNLVNGYLQDGSNNSTDIFSSAKVEFKNQGYGIQVKILTPENITQVSESMYENAAIAAGATNADIQIASVVPVTGEGALAGVYEIFSQSGIDLDSQDIRNAERQIQIEQLLLEQTNLSEREISKLITTINLSIVNELENNSELSETEVEELVSQVLEGIEYDLVDEAKTALIEHGINFSKSDVAKDPETKKALESTLEKYEQLDYVYSLQFELDKGYFSFDNIKILSAEHEDNVTEYPVVAFYYTFTLKENQEPMTANEAWWNSVKIYQETPNTINELISANVPGHDLVMEMNNLVKPGGSVQTGITAVANDTESPIEIRFYNDKWNDNNPLYSIDVDLSLLEIE